VDHKWITRTKSVKKQSLVWMIGAITALVAGMSASAETIPTGFYGGVSMRDNGAESTGLVLAPAGGQALAWNRFAAPVMDDASQRSLVFGGYRWKNDLSVEAAFNTTDRYALHPGSPGLLVRSGPSLYFGDIAAHAWNADVYTSWEFVRSVSLYGRLGYAQSDARPLFTGASIIPGDPRRQREGVNYGLGLRYDVTHSLGLRVEYARFGRFTGEVAGSGLPESDQVSIGVQYRF
jgi:opacity protein-like surface antigen